jgi:acyl-CoA reductase-like NAD-dependent aldehyde dehydrogenase
MEMFLAGEWVDRSRKSEVFNPYDKTVIGTVPKADAADVDKALAFAERGAAVMAKLSAHERWKILSRAATLLAERVDDLGALISKEEGKVLAEGCGEVRRAVETLLGSAEEAKRIHGETVPLDADPSGQRKLGFTLRVPCGVVVAIGPFNFPLNLLCHKVGPALAAGNAVIIKPATDTPLSGLKLTEVLLEAGCPPEGVQCLTGSGGEIGDPLVSDPRVRKISFTGSLEVGRRICRLAGVKKVTMELGSNCPLIVMPDADLDKVAAAVAVTGYANAGQVCISTQRVLTADKVYNEFLEILAPKVNALVTGDQLNSNTNVGPMVKEDEAVRVGHWIDEAVAQGARVVAGGSRSGAIYAPTVVADVRTDMRISHDELFGPAVAVAGFESIDEAIAMANDSVYGLAAGIFTQNVDWAMRFAREVHSGNLNINWGPQWRADVMPYGGLKDSGFGKEGPRYAVEEMTELKMVVFHL